MAQLSSDLQEKLDELERELEVSLSPFFFVGSRYLLLITSINSGVQ